MTQAHDITRRSVAQARRMPRWQRLVDTVHSAQAAKGYEGRQFGAAEMRHFGALLIGTPAELVSYSGNPGDFAAYWVERTVFEHSDGTESVTYRLKSVHGDDLANVNAIAEAVAHTTGYDGTGEVLCPEWEAATARDFVARAHSQAGRR